LYDWARDAGASPEGDSRLLQVTAIRSWKSCHTPRKRLREPFDPQTARYQLGGDTCLRKPQEALVVESVGGGTSEPRRQRSDPGPVSVPAPRVNQRGRRHAC